MKKNKIRHNSEQVPIENEYRILAARQEAILSALPNILMEVDINKVYSWANRAGFEFFGEDVIGKEASSYFKGEQNTYDTVKPLFSGKKDVIYLESWQRRKDGEIRLLAWHCQVLRDKNGNVTGALSSAYDITERLKAESEKEAALQAMRASEGKYQMIFDDAPVGIFQSTSQGQFIIVNPAMANIYGYDSPAKMIASITDISKQIYVDPSERLEFQQSLVENGNLFEYIGKNYRKDKSIIWTQTTARVVKDTLGNIQFYEGFITDITERIQAEAVLKDSEKMFRVMFEKSPIGYTLTSPDGKYLQVNNAFADMLGYSVDELVGKNWVDITVPEDVAPNHRILNLVLSGKQSSTFFEKRFFRKNGNAIEVFISTTLFRDEQNEPRYFITNIIDITERKQAELEKEAVLKALRLSEQQFKLVTELTSDYIYKIGVSADGKVTLDFVTNSYYAATGRDINKTRTFEQWVEIFHPDDLSKALLFMQDLINTHQPGKLECRTYTGDGKLRWIEIVARPEINTEENRVVNIIGAVKDITERKEAETKLQTLSLHDQLTGLYNRGYFEESMQKYEHSRQFPISVLMADVDDLKITNDRDGHATGDELLIRSAHVLTKAFRAEDVVTRMGGDEFVVLLPRTSAVEAEVAVDRFIHCLEEDNKAHPESPLKISCGISTAEKGDSLVETLKEADANMYLDKQSRNLNSR